MGTFFADRADNAELWDVEGQRFIDFAGGIAVMNSSHGPPQGGCRHRGATEEIHPHLLPVVPYESYIALADSMR